MNSWNRLVDHLYELAKASEGEESTKSAGYARSSLAALRSGLAVPASRNWRALSIVAPYLETGENPFMTEVAMLLASLFAVHRILPPDEKDEIFRNPSFGSSMKSLASQTNEDSLERRFLAMLESDPEDTGEHLQKLVQMAGQNRIPIYWRRFALDLPAALSSKEELRTKTLRKWALDYWGQ